MRWALSLVLAAACNAPNPPVAPSRDAGVAADAADAADAGDAAAPAMTATVRVLDPSVKWGSLPRVELVVTNAGSSPLTVTRPGADNLTTNVAQVKVAPVASPKDYTLSPWQGTGASALVTIAPGASETFPLAERAGAEDFLPGKYELSVAYGGMTTASVPFEILSDGSPALAARLAAYEGKDLANVEISLSSCGARVSVGARCQLDIAAKNRGKSDVWLGPGWALRTRSPKGEHTDGNGPRPSGPIRLRPGEKQTLGGWSIAPSAPGRYTFNVVYGSMNGAAHASSPDVVVDVH